MNCKSDTQQVEDLLNSMMNEGEKWHECMLDNEAEIYLGEKMTAFVHHHFHQLNDKQKTLAGAFLTFHFAKSSQIYILMMLLKNKEEILKQKEKFKEDAQLLAQDMFIEFIEKEIIPSGESEFTLLYKKAVKS